MRLRPSLFLCGGLVLLGVQDAVTQRAVAAGPTVESPSNLFGLDRPPRQGALVRGTVPMGTVRLTLDGRLVRFAPDRRFILGFGRDYPAVAVVSAELADRTVLTARLPVAPTAWRIENIPQLARRAQPDAEFMARRTIELDQIAAARRIETNAQGWRQAFIWPVRGRITGQFGAQRIYAGTPAAPHAGIDLAGSTGTPVAAPADGVVILAASAPFTLEGNLVMVDHGMGLNSAFLHLSRIDVTVGQVVRQGQVIGAVGMTGRATGPHLHWGLKWQDERIDPASLVAPAR